MSVFDKLKGMLKGHEDQASKGIDQAGDLVDKKTQGKYAGHVDTAQEKLKGQLGDTGTRPDSPPQPPPPPQQ
ncbi:antitoxin [Streptomyces sp. NPDC096351]|uniref:antitoxin n=1 Tax=Streptomyces sp. NPDC096351 TaxID=3366087 RepID=UPI003817043C